MNSEKTKILAENLSKFNILWGLYLCENPICKTGLSHIYNSILKIKPNMKLCTLDLSIFYGSYRK